MARREAMPTLPRSLPIMSSKGVTEPSRTSLTRLIFSSSTLFRRWGALDMMTKNMTKRSTAGTAKVRTGSIFSAFLIAPGAPGVPASGGGGAVDQAEIFGAAPGYSGASASCWSMPESRKRVERISVLTMPLSQSRSRLSLGVLE